MIKMGGEGGIEVGGEGGAEDGGKVFGTIYFTPTNEETNRLW